MKYQMQICWGSALQTFTPSIFFAFLIALLSSQQLFGQFREDFSDEDFKTFPTWSGTDSFFAVSNNQLQLQAPEENGVAYLSTASHVISDAPWEFKVTLEFNPSANNYTRIYVVADQENLSGSLNGYFVLVGDSKDDVSLYKQTGTVYSKIIDGRDGILDLSSLMVRIKVTRNKNGVWQLFSDVGSVGNYVEEGETGDTSFTSAAYFGVFCKYTSTRSSKFYFDDFDVSGAISKDEIPPVLENVEVLSDRQIKLTFSEALDRSSATKIENYWIDNGLGNPESATLDHNIVVLSFSHPFPDRSSLSLSITAIADINGNVIESVHAEFIFHKPIQAADKDIIIIEIFADPSPSVGLPKSEYVEIYNRSENELNLSGWKFEDQSSSAILPEMRLLPKEYLILTSQNSDFIGVGKVLALSNFPSLNNTSDALVLKDVNDSTIDSVSYTDDWYRDEDKMNGGWSLELIDPNNLCSESENWGASENDQGGTPGNQNSVFANKPDLTGPKLLSAIPLNETRIQLQFDEKLEKKLPSSSHFNFTPEISVSNLSFVNSSLTGFNLTLNQELQIETLYTLSINEIYDCAGNPIQQAFSTMKFGLPEKADSLDVLINEILFNPRPTGVDFVEIVNNSPKFLNLKDWTLATLEDGVLKNIVTITQNDFLFPPGSYLVLTENEDILKGEYLLSAEKNFLKVNRLPGFNDDHGSLALRDSHGTNMDQLIYSEDMHSVFIKEKEGVSLERISLNIPSAFSQNWKSASSTVGFATPGYLNSHSGQEFVLPPDAIRVEPEIFNPVGGQPDFTRIHYNFDQGGHVANVKIVDPQGHLIKQLANNDLLGTTGFYRWDGDRDDGTKARVRYYMIWFEIFDDTGMVKKYQKRVAVATTF